MKILHITYIYPPNINVADGVTNVVYNVTKELRKKGHQVEVFTSNLLSLHNENYLRTHNLMVNGVNIYYSRSLWRYKSFILTPSFIYLLYKHILNFDIIHIHDCRSFQGITTFFFANRYNIPYVFQPHGSYFNTQPQSFYVKIATLILDKLISEKIIKKASKVIALSECEAQQYRSIGLPSEKIVIIPNGIELSKYASLSPEGSFKKKFNIPIDKKIILYIGRINKTKGVDLLVKAFACLINEMKYKDAILVIIGPDDGYLKELKHLVTSLDVAVSVLFTGFINIKEKISALVDASVFVTPSFHGFPVTFLEACSTGTPIITTNLGDKLDWIEGNVGYVTSASYHKLANAIYMIIINDDLRNKFSINCIDVIKSKFLLEKVVDRLEEVYEEVIKK